MSEPDTNAPIRWARRVQQHKIRRLYGEQSTPGMRANREDWKRKARQSTWTGWRAAFK